jgi:plasmid stabilization system protein ParE
VNVLWQASALADIRRILDDIAAQNPAAARRIAQELVLAGDSPELFPQRDRAGLVPGTREPVAIRPCVVVYEVAAENVRILRVWHSAQDR